MLTQEEIQEIRRIRREKTQKTILALVITVVILGGGGFWAIFGVLHNAEPTRMAMATAQASPLLAAELGTPLKFGWLVTGNIQVQGSGGHAEISFSVSGPDGKGTISSEATRKAGVWTLKTLNLNKEGDKGTYYLLVPANVPPAGER